MTEGAEATCAVVAATCAQAAGFEAMTAGADTIVAAAISRSPGREGFPPLRRSSQSETPAPSTVQKQSAAGCVFTPAMKVRPLAA